MSALPMLAQLPAPNAACASARQAFGTYIEMSEGLAAVK